MTDMHSNDSDGIAFCGEISLRGKRWELPKACPATPPPGIDPRAAQIAKRRGVTDLDVFFDPRLRNSMPDPHVLVDMEKAIENVATCVLEGRRIGIVGDYDVDGATSVAILVRFLRSVGAPDVVWRIPMRISEGYGLNDAIVDEMGEAGVATMMVVDNGTAAVASVARARASGMDVVILDHHEAGDVLPDAILVNPKRPDENRAYDYLCTAGLAFLFVAGLQRRLRASGRIPDIDPMTLLGLVALGTVADVVPLVGLNRAYVRMGVDRLPLNPGIRALVDAARKPEYTTYACGFVIGPCLNAAGRLDDMRLGAELLVTEDPERARELADRLVALNSERQQMQRLVVESATSLFEPTTVPDVVVAYDPNWHPGVVGLAASKLVDAFDRPAIVVGTGGKGSCRSVGGFDVGSAIIEAARRGILVKGGGHSAAAGLTIDPERLEDFRSFMQDRMVGFEAPPVLIDAIVPCGRIDAAMLHAFSTLAPFGQGNTTPLVAVIGGVVKGIRTFKEKHVKAFVEMEGRVTEAMAFDAAGTKMGTALQSAVGRRMDFLGNVTENRYSGGEAAYVRLRDVVIAR